jgi:hypothetical protein
MTIRAYFDGRAIVPEEPLRLPVGQRLEVELKGLLDERDSLIASEEIPSQPESGPPNEAMLAAVRRVAEIQRGMNPKPGGDTQAYLREARAGGLYGCEPSDCSDGKRARREWM